MLVHSFAIPEPVRESVSQQVSRFLESERLSPGLYVGEPALTVCSTINSFLLHELTSELQQEDPEALVSLLITRHDEVFSEVRQHKEDIKRDWGDAASGSGNQDTLTLLNQASTYQMAVRFLIEVAVREGSGVGELTNWQTVNKLVGLAESILHIKMVTDLIRYGLQAYGLRIKDDYAFIKETLEDESDIEISNAVAGLDSRYKSQTPDSVDLTNNMSRYISLLNREVKQLLDFNLSDLLRVLTKLSYSGNLNTIQARGICRLSEKELAEVIRRESGLHPNTISRIMRFSTLDSKILLQEDILVRELEGHPVCYALRPFCSFESESGRIYLFGRQSLDHTLRFWTYNVASGRWPLLETSGSIRAQVKNRHEHLVDLLSANIRSICGRHFGQVSETSALSALSSRCPEFPDTSVLSLDPGKRVLALIGVLDLSRGEVVKTIRQSYDQLLGPEGAVTLHYKCTQWVKDEKRAILSSLGYDSGQADSWSIISIMASLAIYWNSYRFPDGSKIDFIPVEQLDQFLKGKTNNSSSHDPN